MDLPTDDEILALHRDAAPTRDAFESVYPHCVLVCRIAEQYFAGLDVDTDLVRAGALLHDVGVYRLYSPTGELNTIEYVRHGVLGHELLKDLGFPEEICRFASRHTGVGITRDEVLRGALPIPVDDYVPGSGEEELVMYADKFHSKRTPPVFVSGASYQVAVGRWGEEKAATFAALRARYGDPELAALGESTGYAVI
ncbi:HDIG domain-containing metalloprotein [Kribbella sp. NPDC051952]|uniref:HDIG domain-containing metalloprotein n=1 Tax=Kribbella sp. NPDC051952 TaxID=3154851 RepID=UPI0034183164